MIWPTLMKVALSLRKESQHAAAKPGLTAFSSREDDEQPQPAQKPAQSLLDEQNQDGQGAQDEPRVVKVARFIAEGYDCPTLNE